MMFTARNSVKRLNQWFNSQKNFESSILFESKRLFESNADYAKMRPTSLGFMSIENDASKKVNHSRNMINGGEMINGDGDKQFDNELSDIGQQFANHVQRLSKNSENIKESNIMQNVFEKIELFDYYDGVGNDYDENDGNGNQLYLTKIQKNMMDKLIESESERMNSFYMVDLGDIIRQHIEWVDLLPNIHPFYAIKCNPDPIIISLLNYVGCGFDCASKHEFDVLINNGVQISNTNNNDKVIFSHPCKHPLHLKYAAEIGINLCTFDNEYEVEKIHEFHPKCKALLRIQVDDSQSICKFNSKYGFNVDDINDVYNMFELCHKYDINLNGIMFHVGSGCLDSNVYKTAIEKSKFLFDIAHNKYDYDISKMNCLDLGGGFPGINEKNTIHFKEIAKVINQSLTYYFNDNKQYKFIAEPGRYYVSKSHSLICDIIAKKKNKNGFMYYINDGMYGSFNSMYFDHAIPSIIPYSINNETDNIKEKKYKSTIFGPTCDSMDKMYDDYLLKEMNIMDKVIIPCFGAYTNAAASGFNGFEKSKSRYVMTL